MQQDQWKLLVEARLLHRFDDVRQSDFLAERAVALRSFGRISGWQGPEDLWQEKSISRLKSSAPLLKRDCPNATMIAAPVTRL